MVKLIWGYHKKRLHTAKDPVCVIFPFSKIQHDELCPQWKNLIEHLYGITLALLWHNYVHRKLNKYDDTFMSGYQLQLITYPNVLTEKICYRRLFQLLSLTRRGNQDTGCDP